MNKKSQPAEPPATSTPVIAGPVETPFAKALRAGMEKAAAPVVKTAKPPEPVTVEKLLGRVQALEVETDDEVEKLTKALSVTSTRLADLEKMVAKIAELPVYGGPTVRRMTKKAQAEAIRTESVSAGEAHLVMLEEAIARTSNPVAKSELQRQLVFARAVVGRS